jgi:hypothetical protein
MIPDRLHGLQVGGETDERPDRLQSADNLSDITGSFDERVLQLDTCPETEKAPQAAAAAVAAVPHRARQADEVG